MRQKLLIIILVFTLMFAGCSASDPIQADIYSSAGYNRVDGDGDGGYWHEHKMDAVSLSPGASGATAVTANALTLGGYQFDAITEYVYFTAHIEVDWDGVSDAVVDVYFEVNVDNSGGLVTDTVDFSVEYYHKGEGERVNTVATHTGSTVVGQAEAYSYFQQTIIIVGLHAGDVVTIRLNLNTTLSEVDDVIVNYIEFRYPSFAPAIER